MEIKKENAIAAYNAANEDTKKVLLSLLPELEEEIRPKNITERVKTFEDACRELGVGHPFVCAYYCFDDIDECNNDIAAFLKLRIICAALNEGWEPQFTENEERWYPFFILWSEGELQDKSDEWKAYRHFISIDDYSGIYAGLTFSNSIFTKPSYFPSALSSRLCLKSEDLADYCGKQFINLWADFILIRK